MSDEEIKTFCELKYKVTFPMYAKIEVNGPNTHELYQFLKSEKPGEEKEDIEWNFAKFLVGKNGAVAQRFHPKIEPIDLEAQIEALL